MEHTAGGTQVGVPAQQEEAARLASRALTGALEGRPGEAEQGGRDLAAGGVALGEGLAALHDLAAHVAAAGQDGGEHEASRVRDALREATARMADGYTAGLTDRGAASLRDTSATLAERQAELWALHRVNAAVNSSLDEDDILASVVGTVAEVMHADVCSIYLFQAPNSLLLQATHGLDERAIGRAQLFIGEGLTGLAAHEGRPIAVENIWSDARAKHLPETGEERFHSILCVPIIVYAVTNMNKLIGVLNIQTRAAKRFSPEEIAFVEMVCGELALAIENARSYQYTDAQLHQKVAQLNTLRRVIALVASTLDLQRVLDTIADGAVALSGADGAAIFQRNLATRRLALVAGRGIDATVLPPEGLGEAGALAQAVERSTRLIVGEGASADADSGLLPGFQSMFCVPFHGRRDTSGAICLYAQSARAFGADTIELLADFAGEAALALENAALYDEAQRSLTAKSALLAEMHHRVKNNLQTVASLLRMGMRHTRSPEVTTILQESQARIQSIAAVHDLLSQEDVGLTTVAQVVQKVVGIADVHFRDPAQKIRFAISGDTVPVATQQATTLAIVLNELLSNAMRHAFSGRPSGTITIIYAREGAEARLTVSDDGSGLPHSFSLEGQKGLGLSIVDTLTRYDLRGHLTVTSEGGTAFTLYFPL